MKLPAKSDQLADFCEELIGECMVSREERRDSINYWMAYYFTGSSEGQQVTYNRCYPHVERLGSFLFSPSDVRFSLEFDSTEGDNVHAMAEAAQNKLNREYHRCNIDLSFAAGVNFGLVKGCMLHKKVWGHDGLEGWLVHPERFGVLREDINDLDRQEAFVQVDYLTKSQFRRMMIDHPDREEILDRVDSEATTEKSGQEIENQNLHQIIMGSMNPVGIGTTSTGNAKVGVVGIPTPTIDPKVMKELVQVCELWVMDDDRQDWTTIRMVKPSMIIEGKYKRRNLCGLSDLNGNAPSEFKGCQPFTKICPNEIDGYFWGVSELANIYRLQDSLNQQWLDLAIMAGKLADPSRVFIGFSGMTPEKWKALKRRGGFASEESPAAKLETLAEPIPEQLFTRLDKTLQAFDDVAGFMPIMQGVGEPGVRAGSHAQTLARNASPRMRDRALLVERQCVEDGSFCLKLLQAHDAEIYNTITKNKFLLSQLPDDMRVTVDSHTSSPAFQEDAEKKAFALHKAGAIGNQDLIKLTHPPHEDTLVANARKQEEAKAAFLQQHPEAMLEQFKPKRATSRR